MYPYDIFQCRRKLNLRSYSGGRRGGEGAQGGGGGGASDPEKDASNTGSLGELVSDVELPPWAASAEDFIREHHVYWCMIVFLVSRSI